MTCGNIVDLIDADLKCPLIIQEGESVNIEGTLVDGTGTAIAKAGVLTFALTLLNEFDLSVINTRNNQNIFDINGGTVADPANFVMRLDPADAVIVDADVDNPMERGDVEIHIARFVWTWNDGVKTRTGIQEVRLRVQKTSA